MKNKPVFILAILLSTLSCNIDTSPLEIDMSAGFVPQVAVSSFLNPDSVIKIKIARTKAAYSTKLSVLPEITSSSIVDITTNTIFNLESKVIKNSMYLTTSEFTPRKGSIYNLKIQTRNPNAIIEVTDTIPEYAVKITDFKIVPIRKTPSYLGKVKFISVKTNHTNYYEMVLFVQNLVALKQPQLFYQLPLKSNDKIITREDYYPSLLIIEAEDPNSLLFRLDSQSEEINLNFEFSSGVGQYVNSIFTSDENIKVQIRSVSYSYFQYKTSLYKQNYAAEGDLLYGMAAPVKVNGNVKGGLGVLGCYCKTDSTVFVAGRPHIENE